MERNLVKPIINREEEQSPEHLPEGDVIVTDFMQKNTEDFSDGDLEDYFEIFGEMLEI